MASNNAQSAAIDTKVVNSLVQELATAAGLQLDEAERVLKVLGLDKLVENATTMQKLFGDPSTPKALSISGPEVDERRFAASADAFRLANLRIALKPTNRGGHAS